VAITVGKLVVLCADPEIEISRHLYEMAVSGDLPGCEAGEGMFVVTATNGTWRYRLGEYNTPCDWWAATLVGQHEAARPTR